MRRRHRCAPLRAVHHPYRRTGHTVAVPSGRCDVPQPARLARGGKRRSHDQGGGPLNAVEWVCRYAGGCLIETPDLPAPPSGAGWRWAATLWLDPYAASGWSRLLWTPGERGWRLPATLAIGDVLEFGVAPLDRYGRPISARLSCWFGWLDHATDYALI